VLLSLDDKGAGDQRGMMTIYTDNQVAYKQWLTSNKSREHTTPRYPEAAKLDVDFGQTKIQIS
jgi:hypothetical protein